MNGVWIRTQDRATLRLCENMEICKLNHGDMRRHEIAEMKNNFKYTLGIYATQDRAIKVLDEIELFVATCKGVFEMPTGEQQ